MKKNFESRFDKMATILHKMGTDKKLDDAQLTQLRYQVDELKAAATNNVYGSDEEEQAFEARLDGKIAELEAWESGMPAFAEEATELQQQEVAENKKENVEEIEKLKGQAQEPVKDEAPEKDASKKPAATKTSKSSKK